MRSISSREGSLSPKSDAQLVHEVKEGRQEAFDQLVLRHQRRIYAIVFRMTENHHDADDLAQETFLAAYRARERFDERQSFVAFVSRIAINLSINHLRRRKRWLKIRFAKKEETEQRLCSALYYNPQHELEHRELLEKIAQALKNLPPHQKAVLVLKVYQEMSYEDIAAILNISKGTVMSRLHRARQHLRDQLKDIL